MNTAYVETLKTNKTILLMSATTLLFAGAAFFYSTMVHGEEESVQEAVAVVAEMTIPVAEVKAQEVNLWSRFSGRIAAVNEAEIRPQVSGRITEIRFKDGASVEKGDILMVIDPRPYEASLKEAKANLASAKSGKALAGRELKRAETLLKEDAIAQRTYDSRVNDLEVAENAILQAEAALIQAKVDVDHAYVKAPFSGQASRAELTVGNLVQAGSAPLLTTLISNDPVYAEFDVDEQTYLKNVYSVRANSEQKVPVRLNVKGIPQMEGSIDSFDNAINPATGTIRARALFENKDGILLPGMYAEIEMSTPTSTSELVVPKTAVATDQDRMFVYVVDEMGVAKYREVTVGRPQNGFIVIQSGLKAGEKIVTDKVGMVRSGQTINVEKVSINIEPAKDAQVAQK